MLTSNMDLQEIMMYLTKHLDVKELHWYGPGRLIPTNSDIRRKNPIKDDLRWRLIAPGAEISPNKKETRKTEGLVAVTLNNFIMSNYLYCVDKTIFCQKTGGPIGLDISRILACIVMIFFDDDLAEMIKNDAMILQLHQIKRDTKMMKTLQ